MKTTTTTFACPTTTNVSSQYQYKRRQHNNLITIQQVIMLFCLCNNAILQHTKAFSIITTSTRRSMIQTISSYSTTTTTKHSFRPLLTHDINNVGFSIASTTRLFSDSPSSSSQQQQQHNNNEEKTEEEKAALKAARDARKAEKQRVATEKKALKAAKKAAEEKALEIKEVCYRSQEEEDTYEKMGDYAMIMSHSQTHRNFLDISTLQSQSDTATSKEEGNTKQTVWIRGRVHSIRIKGGSCFLVVRQNSHETIQATFFKQKDDDANLEYAQKMIRYLKQLSIESIIDIQGLIVPATVKSCSIEHVEVQIQRVYGVSKANPMLPFLVDDAARSEQEVEDSQGSERPFPRLGQELRLDHRWLDLRTPANNSIMRLNSAICQLFRESLYSQQFIEIHSPKLLQGESESGAGVFTTDYFGKTACLAQSPQLYKQMSIASDLNRVFEIGPVFRAENSNTRRHLCEFTGLDLEMSIYDHYQETLDVLHDVFVHIFTGLEERFGKELKVVREQYDSQPVVFTKEPCVIHWPEAMGMLKDLGWEMGDELDDLTGAQELALGKVMKDKYNTDFYIIDKYPSSIRPFYTMPDPTNPLYSNSYDIFLRGQEICSGAQRCHDPTLLKEILTQKGITELDGVLEKYMESFTHGVTPHAGAGIGLERVLFLYLGLDNVRKASLFPRDPNRCCP